MEIIQSMKKLGGRRPGAGRKKGSGKYGEPTKAIRVPVSMVDPIMELIETLKKQKYDPNFSRNQRASSQS